MKNLNNLTRDYWEPTEEEVEIMVNDLAERLKDVTYACAENRMRTTIQKMGLDKKVSLTANDDYSINFNITMVTGDFVQIIANHRRKTK